MTPLYSHFIFQVSVCMYKAYVKNCGARCVFVSPRNFFSERPEIFF